MKKEKTKLEFIQVIKQEDKETVSLYKDPKSQDLFLIGNTASPDDDILDLYEKIYDKKFTGLAFLGSQIIYVIENGDILVCFLYNLSSNRYIFYINDIEFTDQNKLESISIPLGDFRSFLLGDQIIQLPESSTLKDGIFNHKWFSFDLNTKLYTKYFIIPKPVEK
ncbi:MAG TPA: hypothetical protein PLP33_07025 [Leptospiraceae bacterium]|nr:hypothetical protein [Leptospiraceae bacterium]